MSDSGKTINETCRYCGQVHNGYDMKRDADECREFLAKRVQSLQAALELCDGSIAQLRAKVESQNRTIYACSRFFEHCRRVSLSARHAGCDSAEMEIRMSLKKDAEDALEDSR